MEQAFYGSICLSQIPRELIKKIGDKLYLNIRVAPRKEADKYGNTHFVKCSVRKDEQVEGVNYYIGSLKPDDWQLQNQPTTADIDKAARVDDGDDLDWLLH